MIDTHQHLYDTAFDDDRDDVVARAQSVGVTKCLLPGIDQSTFEAQQACALRYPDFCRIAVGLHPTSVNESFQAELDFARTSLETCLAASASVLHPVAIGEIGLDTYWSDTFLPQQIAVFDEQVQWAARYGLPIIIHVRSCLPTLLDSLKRNRALGLRGVLHAWSGSVDVYREANKYGSFKIGIGGVLTYKNARVAESVKEIPLSDILLETDAPWLTPVPFRGKRNECAYVAYVMRQLAAIKGIEEDEVCAQTTQNALSLFAL